MSYTYGRSGREVPYLQKLREFRWGLLLLLSVIAAIGIAMLYSTAGSMAGEHAGQGSMDPWASRQLQRYLIGVVILIAVALIDIRWWMAAAYPAYFAALVLLLGVEFAGVTGMGAKRWVDLYLFRLQPSEVMKIALVLALARYLHGLSVDQISRFRYLLPAIVLIAVPVGLVVKQPDLGTAILLLVGGASILFLGGLRWRIVGFAGVLGAIGAGVGWQFMQDYQKQRVLTFLNPENDPLGTGYHILQSKIALGAGGVFGRGYLQGTQSHLNFLPEKHTDFIFTMFAEEFGLLGSISLLGLYLMVLLYGLNIALQSRNQFGRLVCMGVMVTFLLYILINTAMVMGLVPVVGVPLPLVSYGGTSMLALMFGFGLVMSVYIHRDIEIPRNRVTFW